MRLLMCQFVCLCVRAKTKKKFKKDYQSEVDLTWCEYVLW